jgi:GNAT superfamily N-acetyltransferase
MTDPIRVDRAGDAARYLATDDLVWFGEPSTSSVEERLLGLRPEHRYAAEVDGAEAADAYPGIYGVFPLTLRVPGPDAGTREVPCAGLTWVAVHPDHRRKGVLSAMLRHHFEQVRAEGGHLSALHASEPAIYGRHGYGLASLELEVTLGRGATLTAPHLEDATAGITTSLATGTDPGIAERIRDCHLAYGELGSVVGDLGYYERICTPVPEEARDKEPWRVLFARRDGVDVGCVGVQRTQKWEKARPSGDLGAWAVIGEPAARLVLLRRLVDFDLIGSVRVRVVALEDPLLLWVGGPRAASDLMTFDSLWIRLVDLPAALQARTWSAPCDVVVEVADTSAPWNAGTWRIHADDTGAATVEATSAEPDVRLRTEALGGAYVGGGNLLALHRAGLVEEARRGAAAELWRAMRTDLAPGAAIGF